MSGCKINVIVPIYHGKKYINNVIRQIEVCQEAVKESCILELLFVNDDPLEPIGTVASDVIEVRVLETDLNRGIHGARVRGLEYCTGNYVLFLDQDDVIQENYVESQYRKIGDADAVVCRLVNGKRLHYTDTFRFEDVVTGDFMKRNWCSIVSPGQVLIKRDAIPDIWRKNILKNNGADDYFLWLCMMTEGKQFVLNQDVLFHHVITGKNTSEDTNRMMDSEEEMLEILKREAGIDGDESETLKRSLRRIHIKQMDTQRYTLSCLNQLYRSLLDKGLVYDWLKRQKGNRIAIYGAGELGMGVYDFLKAQGITPVCYLDRNAAFILSEIPAYTVEAAEVQVNSVLLTISDRNLQSDLRKRFGCEVIMIEEMARVAG